jgi:hypothetical protein
MDVLNTAGAAVGILPILLPAVVPGCVMLAGWSRG